MKDRQRYLIYFLMTIALGLLSRLDPCVDLLGTWIGDLLYATMVYWLVSIFVPMKTALIRALLAFAFCLGIELQQISQAAFLVELRNYRLGALVLGNSFSVLDIFLYLGGTSLAFFLDRPSRFLGKKDIS